MSKITGLNIIKMAAAGSDLYIVLDNGDFMRLEKKPYDYGTSYGIEYKWERVELPQEKIKQ